MNKENLRKILPAFIPYIAIIIGLMVFRSAWLAMLGYHAGIAVYIMWSKTKLNPVNGFAVKRPAALIAGLSAGVVVSSFLYFCWPFLSIPADIGRYLNGIGLNERTWPVFLVYFVVVNPLFEEYFWRFSLTSSLKRPVLHDLLFAGYHLLVFYRLVALGWLFLVFLGLTAGAWFWRQLNRANGGGILPSYISHLAADIIVILTIFLQTTR